MLPAPEPSDPGPRTVPPAAKELACLDRQIHCPFAWLTCNAQKLEQLAHSGGIYFAWQKTGRRFSGIGRDEGNELPPYWQLVGRGHWGSLYFLAPNRATLIASHGTACAALRSGSIAFPGAGRGAPPAGCSAVGSHPRTIPGSRRAGAFRGRRPGPALDKLRPARRFSLPFCG